MASCMDEVHVLGWWRAAIPPRAYKWIIKMRLIGRRRLMMRQVRARKKAHAPMQEVGSALPSTTPTRVAPQLL